MRPLIALVVTTAALALPGAAFAGAQHAKFDIEGVDFPDGNTGTIYASSKMTGKGSTFTNCGYETTDGTFLGNYGDASFFSTDADALKQFCLEHFDDKS